MLRSPHHRLNPSSLHYSSSPASTCSDEDSDHSQPNDLSSKHSASYPPHHSYPHSYHHHHSPHLGQQSPHVATNECRVIEYRGARIAAFLTANKNPCEYLLCLPQAFELFLKHLVGGLHTVYTKLKRLDIVPIVCNVEQVRILRGLGAIQPGVNRCKLLSTKDFDVLFKDCTTASRPGRPPKRSPVVGMVSPVPPMTPTLPAQQNVPFLGFPPPKKPRFADEVEFGGEVKGHQGNRDAPAGSAATAAAMLAANGYSAAFPFLQHFANSAERSSQQQQQQLAAAAAALGLQGLPSSRFNSSSPTPPGLSSRELNPHSQQQGNSQGHERNSERSSSASVPPTSNGTPAPNDGPHMGDFNPTAAYLWLLSQQQHHAAALASRASHGHGISGGQSGRDKDVRDNSGLNNGLSPAVREERERRSSLGPNAHPSHNSSAPHGNSSSGNNISNTNHPISSSLDDKRKNEDDDESTDDEDDDVESHNSSHSDVPVSSSGFNGLTRDHPTGQQAVSNASATASPPPLSTAGREGRGDASSTVTSQAPQEQHCLETLLRNIEGLLAIAAHNARQQQSQLLLQKELRAELTAQIEREREIRDQVEKQLNEEQKIRLLYQKRFKKERRFRRKLEQEFQLSGHQIQLHQKENVIDSKERLSPAGDHTNKKELPSTGQNNNNNNGNSNNIMNSKDSPQPASPVEGESDQRPASSEVISE